MLIGDTLNCLKLSDFGLSREFELTDMLTKEWVAMLKKVIYLEPGLYGIWHLK